MPTHDRRRSYRTIVQRDSQDQARERRGQTEDQRLLERATPPAFLDTDTWRSLRIPGEFVEGFDALAGVGPAVSFFGSARSREDAPEYRAARELAAKLVDEGFAVITGGGPGVMEAANRGATEAGGQSIGCNIELPFEQGVNLYVDLMYVTDDLDEATQIIVSRYRDRMDQQDERTRDKEIPEPEKADAQ